MSGQIVGDPAYTAVIAGFPIPSTIAGAPGR
jgi:hypothetical protein